MNNPFSKITQISVIISVLFLCSCEEAEYDNNLFIKEDGEFLYKVKKTYCKGNPEYKISSKTFKYDKKGNRIEEIIYSYDKPVSKITSEYYFQNFKTTDSYYNFTNNAWVLSNKDQYKYSRNRLIEKINSDVEDNYLYKTVYTYSGNLLKYEEILRRSGNDWILNFGYLYKYNGSGQLIEKLRFFDETRESANDKLIYTYKNRKLSTEKRILSSGKTGYFREYTYTSEGLLDEIIQDGNIIEKNFYENGKLIEKDTWYFGFDPGFSPCGGNYIHKYEY